MSGRMSALPVCLGLTVALGACAREVPIIEIAGECSEVFSGRLCTWARMQGDSVIDAGVTVPLSVIEGAPADHAMTWPPTNSAILSLPAEAQAGSGMMQMTFLWESMGHPPGPFLTPHFDFHFYTVNQATREAMDCVDRSKPAATPAGYALPDLALPPPMVAMTGADTLIGLCVPQMGMHALLDSEMQGTALFRGTMVLGYYAGKPIFIEPMLSKAMLLEKAPFDLPIPSIPGMPGNYPRAFRAEFNAEQQSYRFVFSGFAAGTE